MTKDCENETHGRRTIVGMLMLFTTEDSGVNKPYSGLLGPGAYCWDYITVDVWFPWLIAILVTEEDGIKLSSSVFLHQPVQIEGLIANVNINVGRVQLMKPDDKQCLGWDLREVLKINRVTTQSTVTKYYEVVLADDLVIKYPRDFEESIVEKITNRKTLWSAEIK